MGGYPGGIWGSGNRNECHEEWRCGKRLLMMDAETCMSATWEGVKVWCTAKTFNQRDKADWSAEASTYLSNVPA